MLYSVFPNLAISCVFGHAPVGVGRVPVSSFGLPGLTEFYVVHHDIDYILPPVLERLSCSDRIENLAMFDL